MAVLTTEDLVEIRRRYWDQTRDSTPSKAQWAALLQAIEDWFDKPAVKASLSADIDAAVSPLVLTAEQKRIAVKFWLRSRFGREA